MFPYVVNVCYRPYSHVLTCGIHVFPVGAVLFPVSVQPSQSYPLCSVLPLCTLYPVNLCKLSVFIL